MARIYFIAGLLLFFSINALSQQTARYKIVNKHIELNREAKEYYERYLPASVDNSQEIYFPPIYEQSHFVCNQVAASYYMYTYEHNRIKNVSSANPDSWFCVYYPWNWFHGGYGWYGGHVTGTFNLGKSMGMPYMSQSPADLLRDSSIWISGYDNYYQFMHNRIKDYYYIDVSDYEGLITLKAWVYDHARGETPGGLATFMTNIGWGGDNYLPAGTPEAGYYTITKCGDNPLHSRAVVGYNDDICWDYNGDGQYTNNIDLNDDGIINVRDYEKGGFKLAESFGPDWQGHGGFMYIMYKCLADDFPDGGILNNEMAVLEPLVDYQPEITTKIRLNHECRNKIKISIGVSNNPNAETPEYEMDFPALNYEGGGHYMKGGTSEDDKNFEIGFDIVSLLDYIEPGQECRFFLIARELDPNQTYDGSIQEFTIIDYKSNPAIEHTWTGDTAFNSGTLYIPLNVTLNFEKPEITTETLPTFNSNEDFNFTFQGSGGELPYKWQLEAVFDTTKYMNTFDYFTDTKITPDTYFDSIITIDIPFNFPFNGETYNKLVVNTDGYLIVGDNQLPWPYAKDYYDDFFRMERVIGPHMRFDFVCNPAYGDGIWVKSDENHISIRWNVSQKYSEQWTNVDFAVNLYSTGNVEFFYGHGGYTPSTTGTSGISFGNNKDFFVLAKDEIPKTNLLYDFDIYPVPENVQISQTGVLSGNINYTEPYPVKIALTDNNNRTSKEEYYLMTGIEVSDSNNLRVYPNPTSSVLRIKSLPGEEIDKIQIYDAVGRIIPVPVTYLSGISCSMDVYDLVQGMYIIKVTTANKTIVKTFIKQ